MNFFTNAGRIVLGVLFVLIAVVCGVSTIAVVSTIFAALISAIVLGVCTSFAIFGAYCMFAGATNDR